jgi:hypothetical protein
VWRKSSFSESSNDSDCVEIGRWHKSSFSEGNNETACVEIGRGANVIAVRDTKNTEGGMLTFATAGWHAFQTKIVN